MKKARTENIIFLFLLLYPFSGETIKSFYTTNVVLEIVPSIVHNISPKIATHLIYEKRVQFLPKRISVAACRSQNKEQNNEVQKKVRKLYKIIPLKLITIYLKKNSNVKWIKLAEIQH